MSLDFLFDGFSKMLKSYQAKDYGIVLHETGVESGTVVSEGIEIWEPCNIYGCTIGKGCKIGPFVEIQRGAVIGDRCHIASHSFICDGVTLEDEVFIGHGVMFCNTAWPRACNDKGELRSRKDWALLPVLVKRGASIGSGAVILPGVIIGESAMVGAGAVVTRDVPPRAVAVGNPARIRYKPPADSPAGAEEA